MPPGARGLACEPAFAAPAVVERNGFRSVQVNVNPAGLNKLNDAANEPSIAVDPFDSRRMAIGWRQFDCILSDFRQAGWAYSSDAGATWTFPGVLEQNVFRSDPVLAADREGAFFYNSLQASFLCDVYRSDNGGASWGAPVYAFGGDKTWMVTDQTSGPGRNNIYVGAWNTAFGCCFADNFTRSTDGGRTFMQPIFVPMGAVFGTLAVGPDGEVYAAGIEQPLLVSDRFVVARSDNAQYASDTPSFDQVVSVDMGGFTNGSSGPNPAGLLGQLWIAVNHAPGPGRGHVYLVGSIDPRPLGVDPDPLDVHFLRSTDGGVTFTAPLRLNDDPPFFRSYQWFATMSVSPHGRIDVIWADTRNSPDLMTSELYYTWSCDDGDCWSTPIPITPPFEHFLGYPQQLKMGDYYHMISDDFGAHLAYAATFNGEQDVYYLHIPSPDCNTNCIPDAQELTAGGLPDCNTNGMPDACDVLADARLDCQTNGVPDACEPSVQDCNTNATPDLCDLFIEPGPGVPAADLCIAAQDIDSEVEYAGSTFSASNDGGSSCVVNSGGRDVWYAFTPLVSGRATVSLCGSAFDTVLSVHEFCDLRGGAGEVACNDNSCGPQSQASFFARGGKRYLIRVAGVGAARGNFKLRVTGLPSRPSIRMDCNTNGLPDGCERDCNTNARPDDCDLRLGAVDCNTNGRPDACDVAFGSTRDCDSNGTPDACDIRLGAGDCDTNGGIDACDVVAGRVQDCNTNLLPDACDLAAGAADCDRSGVPDACQPDRDGDSAIDACDGCPLDASKLLPGVCGCGASDSDSDGDGVADCLDGCPDDAGKTTPGDCGCGVSDVDSDGDSVPDCGDGCPLDGKRVVPGPCGCGVPLAACDRILPCPRSVIAYAAGPEGVRVSFAPPRSYAPEDLVEIVGTHESGQMFPPGVTTVTYTLTDRTSGESAACSFTVTVRPIPTPSSDANTQGPASQPVTGASDCGLLGLLGLLTTPGLALAGRAAMRRRARVGRRPDRRRD